MWIECIGILIDKSLDNLGIDTSNTEQHVRHMFNTDCIESYREMKDDNGDTIPDEVIVYTKGNGSFVLKHSYNEFKEMINVSKII